MELRSSRGHCGIIVLLLMVVAALLAMLLFRQIGEAFSEFVTEYFEKKEDHGEADVDAPVELEENEVKNGGICYV